MAISYLTGIDLNKNQLKNAQIHVCTEGNYPASPVDGQIIYDSTNQLLKVYKVSGNSGSWSPVGKPIAPGKSIDITNDTIGVDVGGAGANALLTVDSNGEIAPASVTINGKTVVSGTEVTIQASDIPYDYLDDTDIGSFIEALDHAIGDHVGDVSNPHSVTAFQLGAGTLGAGVKATTPAQTSNDMSIATTAYVTQKFGSVDALIYKGAIAGGSTGDYGALTGAASKGEVYKVSAAGKIDGVPVEAGDMIICNADNTAAATSSDYATIAASWDFIQGNVDGVVTGPASSTDGHIAVFSGSTGKVVADSGATLASLSVKTASGAISASATTATVSYSGTYLSSYVKDGDGNLVMVSTTVGSSSVTFTCSQAPGETLTCVVVYI